MARDKVQKAYILNNKTKKTMQFQYNPEEFTDSIGVNFAPLESPGMSYPMFQYIGGKAREVTFELFLDAYEDPARLKVTKPIAFLNSFLPTADSGKTFSPPPTLTFAWGWFVKNCILVDMQIRYTQFDTHLQPTRATVAITLNVLQ